MSSTEPPSRVPPRGHGHQTKAEADALSSKGKVEKVREVDADETRKRKFLKAYEESSIEEEEPESEKRPSPFDLYSYKPIEGKEPGPRKGLGSVDDAIVASPAYTPPPDLDAMEAQPEEDVEDSGLPQSDGFWEDVDFPPDHPTPPPAFQETPQAKMGREQPVPKADQKKKSEPLAAKKEASPFGPPGKVEKEAKSEKKKLLSPIEEAAHKEKEAAQKKKKTELFEERELQGRPTTREEKGAVKADRKEKAKREESEATVQGAAWVQPEEREKGGGGKRGHDQKVVEIDTAAMKGLPAHIAAAATTAANQATSYLHPSTVSLFFQMVGTMYMMSGPQGISRTEILLNNPAFAASKFFGSTIRIEKYATAPDSFNITLSGSTEAVASFKDNIPSLMAAFQNGNFLFKVNRLDVEYSTERPVYRRKEKGEEKENMGGGDFGDRRK